MVDSGRFKTTSFLQESQYFENVTRDALLGGVDKEALAANVARPARRHVDPSSDLSKLDVCFGGFSPTVMGDGDASIEQVLATQKRERERLEAAAYAAAVEAARMSEVRSLAAEDGTEWRYVVIDDAYVRIESCALTVRELAVPALVEEKPVSAIGAEACANLDDVESIELPDSIVSIGLCAFRGCQQLKRIAFPSALDAFDSDWLRGCNALEEMALPGNLEKIAPAVFDTPRLRRLKVGAGTREVLPGAFLKSQLESIEVAPSNPWLRSDGKALYSADGRVLIALASPVEAYSVQDGCVAIAKKGLSSFAGLAQLKLPDSLEAIGDYACAKTGIRGFVAPAGLKCIGERAFFGCAQLEKVVLNAGLESIGENAFTDTSIRELFVPASVEEVGFPVAAHTALTYSGRDATFRISLESAKLKADSAGGLYEKAEDGLRLTRMLDPMAEEYAVHPDCVSIEEGAFQKHEHLRAVTLPEGLRRIGRRAFRDCRALTVAELPDTLEEVGEEAFLATSLDSLRIPARLGAIGPIAFVSYGAFHGSAAPSITEASVAEGNPRFRMENGLLLERMGTGDDSVLLCPAGMVDAVIPRTVKRIAPYAFSGVRALRTLSLSDRITMVEARGLGFDSAIEHVHIDFEEPIEGHEAIDLDLPDTTRAAQQMMLAFGVSPFVNVGDILGHYDNSILNANGFDAATEGRMEPYEQVRRILARMRDPILMTSANRGLVSRVMEGHLEDFCLAIARHDDREAMGTMLDMGYINEGNIEEAIDCVAPVQDASITNYLLEAKQRRFGRAAVDFDADFAL